MPLTGRTFKDGDVISIVRKYLVSGILSPLLAHIMLNEFGKETEKRGLNFVRYADAYIIMVGNEMSANRVMRNIYRL